MKILIIIVEYIHQEQFSNSDPSKATNCSRFGNTCCLNYHYDETSVDGLLAIYHCHAVLTRTKVLRELLGEGAMQTQITCTTFAAYFAVACT